MSRFKRFAHSLASGYVLLGANMLYTLASIPLAWHYLSEAEYGLWSLGVQVMGYVMLIDLGMGGSIARILIDYKSRPNQREYGCVVQTGALVGATQGLLIAVAGALLALVLSPVFKIPAVLERDFVWLLAGQAGVFGISFSLRIFTHMLVAHQRYDVANYTSSLLFVVNYVVMWYFFAHGAGVFSILWSQLFGVVVSNLVNIWACARLQLLPRRGEWGRPSWERFHELFRFGRDFFVFSLGSQLVNASQVALLTRLVGLEMAAVWNVGTRAYTVMLQIICKVFDYSSPALAEMMVHGEKERLRLRFREIVMVSTCLSLVAAAGFAVCNDAFIHVWMAGKVNWAGVNDALLAVWLVTTVSVRLHSGLVGQTKCFGFLRYLHFFEGLAFVGLTLLLQRWASIATMLLISIACAALLSVPYSLWRTCRYFGLRGSELGEWYRGTLRLAFWLVPVAAGSWYLTLHLPESLRLVLNGSAVMAVAIWLLPRYGLGDYLQGRLLQASPAWAKGWLARRLSPARSTAPR